MGLLFRKCTSNRIRATDLIQKVPYGYQQRITNGLEFGNAAFTPLVPVSRAIDIRPIAASATLRGQQYSTKRLWRVGRELYRGTGQALRQTIPHGNARAVADSMFWGVQIYGNTLNIIPMPPPGTILVPTPNITILLITVLDPPICTVLFDPEDLQLLTLTLGITRPRDFMDPGTGGGGQFGYGG